MTAKASTPVILNLFQDPYGSTDAHMNAWVLKQVQHDNEVSHVR